MNNIVFSIKTYLIGSKKALASLIILAILLATLDELVIGGMIGLMALRYDDLILLAGILTIFGYGIIPILWFSVTLKWMNLIFRGIENSKQRKFAQFKSLEKILKAYRIDFWASVIWLILTIIANLLFRFNILSAIWNFMFIYSVIMVIFNFVDAMKSSVKVLCKYARLTNELYNEVKDDYISV